MISTLITTEEKTNSKHCAEKPVMESHDQFLATPQLLVDVSKKEKVIVIKIKKIFRKQN